MNHYSDKKVLVIEDDRVLRRVILDNLKAEGFAALEAEDGVIGLETALREHPDLMLVDVVMPRMDGITMLEKLREDEWGKTANVMMLTNLSDTEKIAYASKKGVSDYLVKADWDIASIIDKVKQKVRGV
ncbi:MAG: response regulator [Candidatus Pacebacteria bacterium]|jgi:DNA-binding response OmpR family regulator|nr:response regulator [Candidatus Paceibacterota bacterium]